MLFLDRVLSVGAVQVETETTFRTDFLMARDGIISPLVCIELFAQSAAALMAHRSALANAPKVSGALLGTRALICHVPHFVVGDTVRTVAIEVFGVGVLAQFECKLYRKTTEGEELAAEGSINVAAGALGN